MKDNQTGQLCDNCNSHITTYRNEKGQIIFECQYCGSQPEDINPLRLDEYEYEDE